MNEHDRNSGNTSPEPLWTPKVEDVKPRESPRPDPDLKAVADFAPPLLRPIARSIATGLSGGGRGLILLVILAGVFLAGELIESRRDWYAGTAAIEQAKLFAVQQLREMQEIPVAQSNVKRNMAEELRALAARETDALLAIKHVEEGWGSPFFQVGTSNMKRFKALHKDATERLETCLNSPNCGEIEQSRIRQYVDLYEMLFYLSRGVFRDKVDGFDSVTIPSPAESELP